VQAADLRAYLSRRWDLLEQASDRWRAERFRAHGPAATFAASDALRRHGLAVAGPPTEERRRADLEHHLKLVLLLERASRALTPG
jgi:hypothetical protein